MNNVMRSTPIPLLIGLLLIIIVSASAVATLTVTTTTTSVSLSAENLQADADTTVDNKSVLMASAASTATGQDAGSAVEATTALATVNSTISADDWIYQLEVKESGISTWGATRLIQIDLFTDGTLVDSLFVKNATADGTVEGVTARFSLGTGDLPDGITVKTTEITD